MQANCTRSRDVGRGFTLIELLVVIAIIAILAAILFPIMSAAKKAGKQSTCLSNEKQVVSALLMFAQDHNDKPPCAFYNDFPEVFGSAVPRQWKACIRPYLKTPKVFLCPSDPDAKYKSIWESNSFTGIEQFDRSSSYRLNNTLVGRVNNPQSSINGYPAVPFKIASVPSPAKLILICESQPYPTPIPKDTKPEDAVGYEWNQVAAYAVAYEAKQAQIYVTMRFAKSCPVAFERHGDGSNYGFADGHVRWMKWRDTWEPSYANDGRNYWNGFNRPADISPSQPIK